MSPVQTEPDKCHDLPRTLVGHRKLYRGFSGYPNNTGHPIYTMQCSSYRRCATTAQNYQFVDNFRSHYIRLIALHCEHIIFVCVIYHYYCYYNLEIMDSEKAGKSDKPATPERETVFMFFFVVRILMTKKKCC